MSPCLTDPMLPLRNLLVRDQCRPAPKRVILRGVREATRKVKKVGSLKRRSRPMHLEIRTIMT